MLVHTIPSVFIHSSRLFNVEKKWHSRDSNYLSIICMRRLNRNKTDGPCANHHVRFKPSIRHHNCNVVITWNHSCTGMETLSIYIFFYYYKTRSTVVIKIQTYSINIVLRHAQIPTSVRNVLYLNKIITFVNQLWFL